MREREEIIRLWFDMWLTQQDLGIDDVFAENVIYICHKIKPFLQVYHAAFILSFPIQISYYHRQFRYYL